MDATQPGAHPWRPFDGCRLHATPHARTRGAGEEATHATMAFLSPELNLELAQEPNGIPKHKTLSEADSANEWPTPGTHRGPTTAVALEARPQLACLLVCGA